MLLYHDGVHLGDTNALPVILSPKGNVFYRVPGRNGNFFNVTKSCSVEIGSKVILKHLKEVLGNRA